MDVSGYLKLGGHIVMRRTTAIWRRLPKMGRQLPTRHLRPCATIVMFVFWENWRHWNIPFRDYLTFSFPRRLEIGRELGHSAWYGRWRAGVGAKLEWDVTRNSEVAYVSRWCIKKKKKMARERFWPSVTRKGFQRNKYATCGLRVTLQYQSYHNVPIRLSVV